MSSFYLRYEYRKYFYFLTYLNVQKCKKLPIPKLALLKVSTAY